MRRNADDKDKKRTYKTDIIFTKTATKNDDEIKKQIDTTPVNNGAAS